MSQEFQEKVWEKYIGGKNKDDNYLQIFLNLLNAKLSCLVQIITRQNIMVNGRHI